jgi:hypothetical protein
MPASPILFFEYGQVEECNAKFQNLKSESSHCTFLSIAKMNIFFQKLRVILTLRETTSRWSFQEDQTTAANSGEQRGN